MVHIAPKPKTIPPATRLFLRLRSALAAVFRLRFSSGLLKVYWFNGISWSKKNSRLFSSNILSSGVMVWANRCPQREEMNRVRKKDFFMVCNALV